jgi:hypothetical protein
MVLMVLMVLMRQKVPTDLTDPMLLKDLMLRKDPTDQVVLRYLLLVRILPCLPLDLKDPMDPMVLMVLIHY